MIKGVRRRRPATESVAQAGDSAAAVSSANNRTGPLARTRVLCVPTTCVLERRRSDFFFFLLLYIITLITKIIYYIGTIYTCVRISVVRAISRRGDNKTHIFRAPRDGLGGWRARMCFAAQ